MLLRWAAAVSHGMLPNRFPDGGAPPEYNAADAALWFVIAAGEYLRAAQGPAAPLAAERQRLVEAIEAILAGYARGTRHRIGVAADGLLAVGEPGVQLTWMDAKIGDWVVTPRTGKPVELQALWLNALWTGTLLGTASAPVWRDWLLRGQRSFLPRFLDPATGRLHDVVDVDHQEGSVDTRFRPNQVLAAGGLPLSLLDRARARALLDDLEGELLVPLGLRTLSPRDPDYRPRCEGGVHERDAAYHQGTAWPWLLGPFVEAWVRARGGTTEARREARARFLPALEQHLGEAGLGHVSEIVDGTVPGAPRGCPFQAWSVGELLRLQLVVLAEPALPPGRGSP